MRKHEDFDPIEAGREYLAYYEQINPSTGKTWTIKEISRAVRRPYGYVLGRLALVTNVRIGTKHTGMLTVEQIERLFDDTPEGNAERRKAFAECMGISLQLAIDESHDRRSLQS